MKKFSVPLSRAAVAVCLATPLWAFGGSVAITTTLDANSPTFARPGANCFGQGGLFKFTAVDFVVDAAGSNYSLFVPATGAISDPFAFLYRSPFTASLPTVNCIKGNDDSGLGYDSLVANVTLEAGKVYTAIITLYDNAENGTLTATLQGTGNFSRVNGFIKATGVADWSAGTVALSLRLSGNGVSSSDDLKWVAVAPGSAMPTFAEVIAGQQSGGTLAPHSGTLASQPLNSDINPVINGLSSAGAPYDVYVTLHNGGLNGTVRLLDFTPNVPVFTAQTGAALSSVVTSNAVALSGFTEAVAVSVVGGEYRIGSGAYTAAPGTVSPGQSIMLRQTSAAAVSTTTTTTLTVGGVSADFDVTTAGFVDGACGTDSGQFLAAAPSSGLCAAGTPGTVSGPTQGPWFWSCAGIGVGVTRYCSANAVTLPGGNGGSAALPPPGVWGSLPESDNDGVADYLEGVVPSPDGTILGDGNGDGIADAQQPHVASLPLVGGGAFATVASSLGIQLSGVQSLLRPADVPASIQTPYGALAFTAAGLAHGASADFEVWLPYDPAINAYLKRNRVTGGWDNVATSVSQVGNKTLITFQLTDGDAYDSSGTPDGVIVDPGVPAIMAAAVSPIPTLSDWAKIAMTSLMGWLAIGALRRRGQAADSR